MGLFNFTNLNGVRFICNEFNKQSFDEREEIGRMMLDWYESVHSKSSFLENLSSKEKTIGIFISQVGIFIKMENRYEFRRYTPYDLNRLCKGRFELLAFIAFHQGDKRFFEGYINNENHLRKDCKKIYEIIEKIAPSAITLDFNSFVHMAKQSLDENHPY
jgi:hypothetical protein